MPTIKPTEEGQRLRLERLASLREDKKNLSDFAALKDYPAWSILVTFLKKRIEFAKIEESNAAAYHDGEEINSEVLGLRVARARAKRMAFDFVIECVEKKDSQLKIIEAEILEVEKKFKAAKEVLA